VSSASSSELLTDLGERLGDRLASRQRVLFAELVDVGEWGLALEMLADWLSAESSPISAPERGDLALLAARLGNTERVMGPLELCPEI
jgi:hypothetical protein